MLNRGYWNVDGRYYEKGDTWRMIQKRYSPIQAKIEPIDRVINECRRRADDLWWDGEDEDARIEEAYIKLYEQEKEEGILWVPNF